MLRISYATSGEEVATVPLGDLLQGESEPTICCLKRHLAEKHFRKRYTRFQLRILREGDPTVLQGDEAITAPLDLQLLLMNLLQPDVERDAKFLVSCKEGDVEEVQQSLESLQDPNLDATDHPDDSPLCAAALQGHAKVVDLLLEARADTEWRNSRMMRALHFALREGQREVVSLLLASKADTDAKTAGGEGPLHFAVSEGDSKVVQQLLDSKADKEATDSVGYRPLHLAAARGHMHIVRLLLDSGAQKAAASLSGRTPSHCAAANGHLTVVSLLQAWKRRRLDTSQGGRKPRRCTLGSVPRSFRAFFCGRWLGSTSTSMPPRQSRGLFMRFGPGNPEGTVLTTSPGLPDTHWKQTAAQISSLSVATSHTLPRI